MIIEIKYNFLNFTTENFTIFVVFSSITKFKFKTLSRFVDFDFIIRIKINNRFFFIERVNEKLFNANYNVISKKNKIINLKYESMLENINKLIFSQ